MTTQNPYNENPHKNDEPLPIDGLIRVEPLAKRLGIHAQTLRRWWKAGKFPKPQNINGILLFANAEVKAWLDKHAKTPN